MQIKRSATLALIAIWLPAAAAAAAAQIRELKVTILSTMLADDKGGVGEWGFAALIEADGHRILLDTGARPETVRQNAREMKIDLSNVREVILTHNHDDHTTGLMTLRNEARKSNPAAFSVVHVSRGIFYSRPSPQGEKHQRSRCKGSTGTGGKRRARGGRKSSRRPADGTDPQVCGTQLGVT